MVLENVIFLVGVDPPMGWCSTPNNRWVIRFYRGERISKFTEAYQTITISIVAREKQLYLITGNNKSNVTKSISEFAKTQKAAFPNIKHPEGITDVEVRFNSDAMPCVFYVALNLNCFQKEVDRLYRCLCLKRVTKASVVALVGLWHILKRLRVDVLRNYYLQRLWVHWPLTLLLRH